MTDADVLQNTPNFQGKPYEWWRYFRWKGRILCNFRLRMRAPKEIPSGDVWWRHFRWKDPTRADIEQLPIAHARIPPPPPFEVTWPRSLPVAMVLVLLYYILYYYFCSSTECTGCACAGDRFRSGLFRSRDRRNFLSGPFPVAPPHSTTSNTTL